MVLLASLILQILCSSGASAGEDITPAEVFVRVGVMRKELESIRYVMGRPKNSEREISVVGARPREVFFQAITMFRKADRLCFEHVRERVEEPKPPEGEITPQDVYRVVEAAIDRIRRVKRELGVDTKVEPAPLDPSKTPSDVFRSAVQANRQLNLLLERQFAPSDVFQQVTVGVGYASRLLESFPNAEVMPPEPKFEDGKRPADVYRRLVTCFGVIREVAERADIEMLELEIDEEQIADARPSDVYDVASLLISELAYLHARLPDAQPPRPVYYVGRKFPSHVYQRVGILELQIEQLHSLAAKHPDWLSPTSIKR